MGECSCGGTGEPNDPYQIGVLGDLLVLAADINLYTKCFILTADIDLDPDLPGGRVFATAVIAPNAATLSRVGAFKGIFDGAGHKITNLTINTNHAHKDYLGLFGYVFGGEIKNLGLENVSITVTGISDFVGGLAGVNDYGSITNCYVTGAVNGGLDSVGGLVGINWGGSISDCYATVAVSNGSRDVGGLVGNNSNNSDISHCRSTGPVGGTYCHIVGGLVGYNSNSTISNCYSMGAVTGSDDVGGLVGENYYGAISGCYSTGAVTGRDYSQYIGGLVGNSYGSNISNCFSTGTVAGGNNSQYLGGLVGDNDYGSISNCYSTGDVTGGDLSYGIGGLVGCKSNDSISNCYSTGAVTGGDNSQYLGGLVGRKRYGSISISSSYFLITSGPDNGLGTPLTDELMKQQSSFIDWDFNTPVWIIDEGVDSPHLWWENAAPVTDAGPEQTVYAWLDGIAEVNLDGSGSYDDFNQPLTYLWTWSIDGNTYDTNGVNPIIELPVGQHVISLTVNDGLIDSEPNEVNITVVGPIEANLRVMPKVLNLCTLRRNRWRQPRITTMLRLPKGITRDQIDTNKPILLYPGEIEADWVWIYPPVGVIYPPGRIGRNVTIFALFDTDELMDAIPDTCPPTGANGRVELAVVGQLKTGQYSFGTDNIRVICFRRWPWHRPWWDYR